VCVCVREKTCVCAWPPRERKRVCVGFVLCNGLLGHCVASPHGVCVCVRERKIERERERESVCVRVWVMCYEMAFQVFALHRSMVCVCVCVCVRERDLKEREREGVCVRVWVMCCGMAF